jgi:2-succinyl-6-hydroxy-2,4-cyclohexadiene-1-carboxylate synthase
MTLLFLHGFTGAPSSWDAVVERLPAQKIVRPWLPGHGPSAARATSWAQTVAQLAELAREHAPVHLVGYSMGGRLAWDLLAREPSIAGATLIGAHPGLQNDHERTMRAASDARWAELLEREGIEPFLAAWEALPIWSSQDRLPALIRDRQRILRRSHHAHALAEAMRTLGLANMPAIDTRSIEKPITLVAGQLDATHRQMAERLASSMPNARLAIVPHVGHNVVLERPEAIAELLAPADAHTSLADSL